MTEKQVTTAGHSQAEPQPPPRHPGDRWLMAWEQARRLLIESGGWLRLTTAHPSGFQATR